MRTLRQPLSRLHPVPQQLDGLAADLAFQPVQGDGGIHIDINGVLMPGRALDHFRNFVGISHHDILSKSFPSLKLLTIFRKGTALDVPTPAQQSAALAAEV